MGELSRTFWSRIRGNNVAFTKDKETVGNGKLQGSDWKETTAVSRTIENKRAKTTTQPTPSPQPSTQTQGVKKSARFKSPGGRSPSGKTSARYISKELVRIHLVKSGIPRSACSARPKRDSNSVISASLHTARLKNSPAKVLKRMTTKVQWLCWRKQWTRGVYFKTWSLRNLHRFYGRAWQCGNLPDVFDSLKPYCAMPKSETKIHRSTNFAQGSSSAQPQCGRLVLGQGAKVLSGRAQGFCPRHRGSWRCRAVGTAGWSER